MKIEAPQINTEQLNNNREKLSSQDIHSKIVALKKEQDTLEAQISDNNLEIAQIKTKLNELNIEDSNLKKQILDTNIEIEEIKKILSENKKIKDNKNKHSIENVSEREKRNTYEILKNYLLTRVQKARLATVAFCFVGAFATTSATSWLHTVEKDKAQRLENLQQEEQRKKEKENAIKHVADKIKESMDIRTYLSLKTPEAKERYVSLVFQNLKHDFLKKQMKIDVPMKDIYVDETQKIKDLLSLTIGNFESHFKYDVKNPNSTATGKYEFIADHLPEIGLEKNKWNLEIFRSSPRMQEELFDKYATKYVTEPIYRDKKGNLIPNRVFTAHYIGHPIENLDYVPDNNSESVGKNVAIRSKYFEKIKNHTRGDGQWVFDNTNVVNSFNEKQGILRWVSSDNKSTFEIQMPSLVSGDKNSAYIKPIGDKSDVEIVDQVISVLNEDNSLYQEIASNDKNKNSKNAKGKHLSSQKKIASAFGPRKNGSV